MCIILCVQMNKILYLSGDFLVHTYLKGYSQSLYILSLRVNKLIQHKPTTHTHHVSQSLSIIVFGALILHHAVHGYTHLLCSRTFWTAASLISVIMCTMHAAVWPLNYS